MLKVILGIILSLGLGGVIILQTGPHFPGHKGYPPVAAPEIDPAATMSGLTLLAGGLVVLRGRRARKQQ
jgi:hypothetical protein